MEENIIWRDITDYIGLYKVSNTGEVFSIRSNKNLVKCHDKEGYLILALSNNGKRENKKIHRLVALEFIFNDDKINKIQVNHKDEDKTNNNVENLEWCTPKYNANFGTRNERFAKKQSIPIVSIDINNGLISQYCSLSSVNVLNYDHQGVSMCLNKKSNTYKNCIWITLEKYNIIKDNIEEFISNKIINSYNIRRKLYSIDNDNNILNFKSLREAERSGFDIKSVKQAIANNTKYKNLNWYF